MDFLRFTSTMQTSRTASWDIAGSGRPNTLQNTKSFSRLESPPRSPQRTRATTLQGTIPEISYDQAAPLPALSTNTGKPDIFSTVEDGGPLVASPQEEVANAVVKPPETFEELPIEIRSLTERSDLL